MNDKSEKQEPVIINGHKLPDLLVKFINQGKWVHGEKLPESKLKNLLKKSRLESISVWMNGIESMKRNHLRHFYQHDDEFDSDYIPDMEKVYGVRSSKYSGKPISEAQYLDVDNAVLIADTGFNEDMIHLDFRSNSDDPRVLAYIGAAYEWTTIAPDFTTFAKELNFLDVDEE